MNVIPLLHSFNKSMGGGVSIRCLRQPSLARQVRKLHSSGCAMTIQAASPPDKKETGDGDDSRNRLSDKLGLGVCANHSVSLGRKENRAFLSLCGTHIGLKEGRPINSMFSTESISAEITQGVNFVRGVLSLSGGLTRGRTINSECDIRSGSVRFIQDTAGNPVHDAQSECSGIRQDKTGNVRMGLIGIDIGNGSNLDFSLSVGRQHLKFSHHLVCSETRHHKRKSLFLGGDRQVLDKLFSIQPSRSVLKTMTQNFHNDTRRLDKTPATLIQSFHSDASRLDKTQAPLTLESEDDLVRLTQQVMKTAGEKDVMVRSVPERQVQNLILDLHRCGLQVSDIVSLLSSEAVLLVKHRATLSRVHMLLSLGFDAGSVKTLLQCCPASINIPQSQVTQVIDALRALSFREESMVRVVTHNPGVLTLSPSQLSHRVNSFRQLFKSVDVVTLTLNSPQILTDPWEDIQAKFDYVFHEMNVTQKQMVHACVFANPLLHIKTRHAFLVRAGLFLMGKRREGERSPNARLDQIIDTSDKQFCRKFGGFELAEYRAFSELFSKEEAMLEATESQTLED